MSESGSENLTSKTPEETSDVAEPRGRDPLMVELEAAAIADDLIHAHRMVFVLAGMVSGLLMALWLVLMFQHRGAN